MHKNLLRRLLATAILTGAAYAGAHAQTTPQEKKVDLAARKAIKFMNDNKPDSTYAMTGPAFKAQVSKDMWDSLYETQFSQLMPLGELTYIKSADGVNEYKLKSVVDLSYYVSLDAQGKIQTFLFKPYQAAAPAGAKPEREK